ncbi:hypothetical protein [Vibrio cholerae]|nr:hypothetical protein [Vibrio cholerae]
MKSLLVLMGLVLALSTNGCSSLTPVEIAKDVLLPDQQSGITVDTQIGDKEYALGSNLEVKADKVENVIGRDDVKNEAQVINQTNVPTSWFIVGVLGFFLMTAVAVIGWLMPVPKWCK